MLSRVVASQTNKIKPELVEIAERIGLSIRQLQSSLGAVASKAVSAEAALSGKGEPQESEEDLDQQLRECFDRARDVQAKHAQPTGRAPTASSGESIYDRVIDGIVDQILHDWDRLRLGAPGAIEDRIVERLIARIRERLGS